MILRFPDAEILHFVLAGGLLPSDILLSPANYSRDESGSLIIEPSQDLPADVCQQLETLGVSWLSANNSSERKSLMNWLQAIPLVAEPTSLAISPQTPVLFELSDSHELHEFVRELLRLGNDRQFLNGFVNHKDAGQSHLLLRVIGPPYYALLRALERDASLPAMRAYLERSPRVWIELGYQHPLSSHIVVDQGQLLLMHSPNNWNVVAAGGFRDIYEKIHLELPASPFALEANLDPQPIHIPLRLTHGTTSDPASFWVIEADALSQLDSFVTEAAESVLSRLTFAVGQHEQGKPAVVLRLRPSRLPPPVLTFENASAYYSYRKLNNLYVPINRRLYPSLRRDVVRELLAADPEQVIWLQPDAQGMSFVPMSLPDTAFRPLEEWVSYIIEQEHQPLAEWVRSCTFEFESFACQETHISNRTRPRVAAEPVSQIPSLSHSPKPPVDTSTSLKRTHTPRKTSYEYDSRTFVESASQEDGWKKQLKELETAFLGASGGLDSPARLELWPQLAETNRKIGDRDEASLCWLHALWESEDPFKSVWLRQWSMTEFPASSEPNSLEELSRYLTLTNPSPRDCREFVAALLNQSSSLPPSWLIAYLPRIHSFLEQYEHLLPIRAVWLTALRLSELAGNDHLGLARWRDRLFLRLYESGFRADQEMPTFLRYAGSENSEAFRAIKGKIHELHSAVQQWTQHISVNRPYVDLYFAFALARLGEPTEARRLIDLACEARTEPKSSVGKAIEHVTIVKAALSRAFRFRIEEALANRPHAGPLPPEVLQEMEGLTLQTRDPEKGLKGQFSEADYAIAKLREDSLILEPEERYQAYGAIFAKTDPFRAELIHLGMIRVPKRLMNQVRIFYEKGIANRSAVESRLPLLHAALPFAPRAGQAFVMELLQKVPQVLLEAKHIHTVEDIRLQAELLQRSLQLASLYDLPDIAMRVVETFQQLLTRSTREDYRLKLINLAMSQCLRTLVKGNHLAQMEDFLELLENKVLRIQSIGQIPERYSLESGFGMWASACEALIHLAAGCQLKGQYDRAASILNDARQYLFSSTPPLSARDYTRLAKAYLAAAAIGGQPTELARIIEFFRRMPSARVTNSTSTAPYYSRYHLEILDRVIWSLTSDTCTGFSGGGRWREEDELLLRRRIHQDFRRHMGLTLTTPSNK